MPIGEEGYVALMPIVTQCEALGCETLTMGPLCVEHEHLPVRAFVRGRPFVKVANELSRRVSATTVVTPTLRRASERRVAALHHH